MRRESLPSYIPVENATGLPHAYAAEMKVAFGQINTTVGDLKGNGEKILAVYQKAAQAGADLVLCPELATCGYPPRDLLLKSRFIDQNLELLERLAKATGKTGLVVGYVGRNKSGVGREATNSVALMQNGRNIAARDKTLLPTYDVFDEDRYFEPATQNQVVEFNGRKIGLTICEDVWNDEDFWHDSRRYRLNPARELVAAGAELILNVSASPWHSGKNKVRQDMLSSLAAKLGAPLLYCNLVGGNDELVFDGSSLGFDAQGRLIAEGAHFREDFFIVDLKGAQPIQPRPIVVEEGIFDALVLGLRDYLHKCGFKSAVLGLSGGIDSAITAVIAAHALGAENVRGVSLPSQFSSRGSLDDAASLARRLGIRYDVIPIEPIFESAKQQLRLVFKGLPEDTTEENMQARIRGMILMALSNKFGSLLLTTGNKSELAVGYCTIYGDMCGGLAVISDVPKTMIYKISKWINRNEEIIPNASITKPPSAELRPNQTDQDSLPPYDVLDAILEMYVVQMRSSAEIIAAGFDEAVVRKIVRLIDLSEYKRRQAAPGLKVTSKAFGVGRRIPIAQRYQS
ncbi:MAG TPA: NAD+ synthase [Verrucomicrobiae bacterium]|nr:NAD+ synthase [Verrucomicrobiae bacterium]